MPIFFLEHLKREVMGGDRLHPSHTVSVNMGSAIITWNKLDVGRAYTGWSDHIIIVDAVVVSINKV